MTYPFYGKVTRSLQIRQTDLTATTLVLKNATTIIACSWTNDYDEFQVHLYCWISWILQFIAQHPECHQWLLTSTISLSHSAERLHIVRLLGLVTYARASCCTEDSVSQYRQTGGLLLCTALEKHAGLLAQRHFRLTASRCTEIFCWESTSASDHSLTNAD